MISVDGYRLALRKEKINSDGDKLSFVIPGKTLQELSKIIKDSEGYITISTTEKHVLFEFDNCLIISRLLEGEFLNYKGIIPSQYSLKVKIPVYLLIESIERASLMITSENKKYPVKLNIILDKILISCVTDMGKVQDLIHVETHGDDIEIGFNHKYLLDALKACECEEIVMEFNNNISPCIIRPVEGDSFIYLVLPVRLKND
jgi:DNA polymerase-3 subunit beta